jgi:hypothetical protein
MAVGPNAGGCRALAFGAARTTNVLMKRSRATARLAAVVFLLGTIVGCGSDGRDPGADPAGGDRAGFGVEAGAEGPRVVLGSGREAFEAVEADGVVPLIKGIQGGFHVWTSFLIYGFDTDVVRMELATRWDMLDDSLLEMKGNVSVRPATDPSGMPALVSLGWPASIFNPACSNGQRLDLAITVRDQNAGISASDARQWVVDVAEEDRSSDCAP